MQTYTYISGNPYDLGRIISTVLHDAAEEDWESLSKGRAVLEAMSVKSSFIAPLDRLIARELRAYLRHDRFYLLPPDLDALERLDAIMSAALEWGQQAFNLPLPTISLVVSDDFAAPTFVAFDTPSLALIQIPKTLLSSADLERLLWHEIGHCYLRCGSRFLDEGLATWVEMSRANGQFDVELARKMIASVVSSTEFTLSELLATGFTNTLGFEDRVSDVSEREALYPKAALVINGLVDQIGHAGLANLFQAIKQQPAHAKSLMEEAVGERFSVLSSLVHTGGVAHGLTATIDTTSMRAKILSARASVDEDSLHAMAEELFSSAIDASVQLILIDAYVSSRELGGRFSKEQEKSVDALFNQLAKRAQDVQVLELSARFILIKLIDAQNFFDRATLAAKANTYVDAALRLRANTPDALLTRAHLLIHTPVQYGGDPDAGRNLLLKVAKRSDEFAAIAISIFKKNFGQNSLHVDTKSPANEDAAIFSSEQAFEDIDDKAPLLFSLDGLSFGKNTDFSLELDQFEVRAGEMLGLIGPNGAGKSLLLECCLGLNMFEARSHQIFGENFSDWHKQLKNRKKIGAKLHRLGFDTAYRVSDIVLLARASFGRDDADIYDLFAIAPLLKKKYAWLSTGQRQRVDLYFAFHRDAQLLFLDEPTLGLDDEYTARLFDLISARIKQGTGIVVVSHNQKVLGMCHRIAVLANGRLQASGKPRELCAQYLAQYRVDVNKVTNIDDFEQTIRAMQAHFVVRRDDSLIAMGDQAFLARFQRSAAESKLENYQLRRSELSDLYAIAGSLGAILESTK